MPQAEGLQTTCHIFFISPELCDLDLGRKMLMVKIFIETNLLTYVCEGGLLSYTTLSTKFNKVL